MNKDSGSLGNLIGKGKFADLTPKEQEQIEGLVLYLEEMYADELNAPPFLMDIYEYMYPAKKPGGIVSTIKYYLGYDY